MTELNKSGVTRSGGRDPSNMRKENREWNFASGNGASNCKVKSFPFGNVSNAENWNRSR